MGVGDTVIQGSQRWSGGGSNGGYGKPAGGGGFGGGPMLSKSLGDSIGSSVQPMQPMQTNQSPGGYTGGQVVQIDPGTGGISILGQGQGAPQVTSGVTSSAPRDWYDTVGGSERLPASRPATPVSATPTFGGDAYPPDASSLLQYLTGQMDYNNINANYGLDSQMLALRRQLLGIDNQGIGTDRSSIDNRRNGVNTDSDLLRQQRGLYDQQLGNQLAQIDTRHQLDRLDHENQYVSGGAWFAPGQKYRRDRIDSAAEQNRTDARLGTQMSQLGIDRSLAGNDTQLREYDFDMQRLDQRMAANGINMQMLGVNQQQLGQAFQDQLNRWGLGQLDAADLLNMAGNGTEQGDFILNWIFESARNGTLGQGAPPPFPG